MIVYPLNLSFISLLLDNNITSELGNLLHDCQVVNKLHCYQVSIMLFHIANMFCLWLNNYYKVNHGCDLIWSKLSDSDKLQVHLHTGSPVALLPCNLSL